VTDDLDSLLYEEMQDKNLEGQLRFYRDWLDKHRSQYDVALAAVDSPDFWKSYRKATADALERLRAFAPGKDGDSKAVYAVAQAVLMLGQAEAPMYTIDQYRRSEARYAKLIQTKEAKRAR
jgi:hypothetical protein